MSAELQFGFEAPAMNSFNTKRMPRRLVVTASPEVYDRARERSSSLDALLDELKSRRIVQADTDRDSGLRIGINSRVIGRARSQAKKERLLTPMNNLISQLVIATGYDAQIRPRELHLKAYFNLGSGDFGIHAELKLPELGSEVLTRVVHQQMTSMARSIDFTRDPVSSTARIGVSVDRYRGVELSQSTHSGVYATLDSVATGGGTIDLISNNVFPFHEPLIYLAGLTALAHAAELANS